MPSYDWQSASEGKTYNFSTTLLEKGIIQNMLVEKKKKKHLLQSPPQIQFSWVVSVLKRQKHMFCIDLF